MKYFASFLMLIFCLNANAQEDRLVLGVLPIYSAIETAKMWSGFADHLSKEIDMPVTIKTTRHTDSFVFSILSGEYDLVFMTHEHFATGKDKYHAIGIPQEKKLKGAIITRKDSGIKSLKDLNGKKIAFPSPNDYLSSVQMCENLTHLGISYEIVYLNSISSVIIGVEKGFYAAGSVLSGLYENKEELQTVFASEEFSTYVMGMSKKLSPEKCDKLNNAVFNAHNHKGAKETMRMLGFSSFIPYENHK